jgi:GxxExxY protein
VHVSGEAYDIEQLIRVAMDCGFAIHRALGPGLLETAYEALMVAALQKRGLRVERQTPIALVFEDIRLDDVYRLDLLVEDQLIIELKSVEQLAPVHRKQLLTYLRITNRPVGLLMNFGESMMKQGISRVINDRSEYRAPRYLKGRSIV